MMTLDRLAWLGVWLLAGCAQVYTPKYIGQQPANPEQVVTFIGQDNNYTNHYTRTQVTLEPYLLTKKNTSIRSKYVPYAIATYPIPTKVYVACSNFRSLAATRMTNGIDYEYRKSYVQEYDFKPGKFYKFDCHKKDSKLSGEYTVSMQVFDSMPHLKTKL